MEFQFLILFRLWNSSHICDSSGFHLRPILIAKTGPGNAPHEDALSSRFGTQTVLLLTQMTKSSRDREHGAKLSARGRVGRRNQSSSE